jgi:hypothetical protein
MVVIVLGWLVSVLGWMFGWLLVCWDGLFVCLFVHQMSFDKIEPFFRRTNSSDKIEPPFDKKKPYAKSKCQIYHLLFSNFPVIFDF